MLSIYPAGVDWKRMRLGPHAREIEARHLGSMDGAIDRADNRATMVFALGVVVASIMVVVTLVAAAFIACVWVLDAKLGLAPDRRLVAWSLALVTLPYAIAFGIDRWRGERMDPQARGTRLMRGVIAVYSRLGFGMANNPALALMTSHRGQGWTMVLMIGILSVATIAAGLSYAVVRDPDAYGSYGAFPDKDDLPSRSLDPAHYDDRRDPVRSRIAPYLQSAVIIGPYAQLVVPWVPDRDGPALQKLCGALPADRQLGCYAERVRPVTLDGKPIAPVFDIGEDARTNRPALVAMIDVRDIPRGRHVLGITLPRSSRDDDDDPVAEFIPFWR
jgi:hypothetical protein